MKCPQCGEENVAQASYCAACGRKLPATQAVQQPEHLVVRIAVPRGAGAVDLWLTVIGCWVAVQAFSYIGGAFVLHGFTSALGALSRSIGQMGINTGMGRIGLNVGPVETAAFWTHLLALFFSLAGIVAAAAAIGLFRRRSWGRDLTVVTQVLSVLIALLWLIQAPSGTGVLSLIETSVVAGVIWIYMRRAEVGEVFTGDR